MNDSEHRFARRFVIGVTILTLAAGWGGAALIRSAFPGHYLSVFPYIPLGFLLWELLFITLLDRNRGRKRFIWLYMGMKVAKLLLAIVAIGRLYAGRRRAEHGFRADAHGILSDLPDL